MKSKDLKFQKQVTLDVRLTAMAEREERRRKLIATLSRSQSNLQMSMTKLNRTKSFVRDTVRMMSASLLSQSPRTDVGKCLVLHGWRSNSRVSEVHSKRLRLFQHFAETHCVDGTDEATRAADDATSDLIDGPWFSWVCLTHIIPQIPPCARTYKLNSVA